MIVGGCILIAGAYGLIRSLQTPRHGFTSIAPDEPGATPAAKVPRRKSNPRRNFQIHPNTAHRPKRKFPGGSIRRSRRRRHILNRRRDKASIPEIFSHIKFRLVVSLSGKNLKVCPTARPLSNLQLELLKLYSSNVSVADLLHIKHYLARYFAFKAIGEADKLWDEKGYTNDTMDQWLNEDDSSYGNKVMPSPPNPSH